MNLSLAESLASLPDLDRAPILASLTEAQAEELKLIFYTANCQGID